MEEFMTEVRSGREAGCVPSVDAEPGDWDVGELSHQGMLIEIRSEVWITGNSSS